MPQSPSGAPTCAYALRHAARRLCLVASLLVAACGGGGDMPGEPSSDEPQEASKAPHADQKVTSVPAPAGGIPGVRITADNSYTVFVNGVRLGGHHNWRVSNAYPIALKPGDVVAVEAVDHGIKAGLIAEVTVGGAIFGTGSGWKVSSIGGAGWNTQRFDDSQWAPATEYGSVDAFPWGLSAPLGSPVSGISTTSAARWIWTSDNAFAGKITPRAFFRFVVPAGSQLPNAWSNPAAWGGTVPPKGSAVIIPANTAITLDQDVEVSSLTVAGTLRCANTDLKLSARYILVTGRLACGTPQRPFLNKFAITLTGQAVNENIEGMGSKFLATTRGGAIDLIGQPRAANWTQLSRTAEAGATTIQLRVAPGWVVGDQIVIAGTSRDMNEAEVRNITAVSGSQITLDKPLRFRHFGETESYGNGTRTWTLDSAAEVGLLTHNIVIQGDEASAATRFGGHTMFMAGSPVRMSNVTLKRMGQAGRLGRYPFHWHLAGDASGQYIVSSSIVES
jgi:hypothetical protein